MSNPTGTPLISNDPMRAICHPELDDSSRRAAPTVGDLQMQLTTALETVNELTNEIENYRRANAALQVALDNMAGKYADALEAAKAVAKDEKQFTALIVQNKILSCRNYQLNVALCAVKAALNL